MKGEENLDCFLDDALQRFSAKISSGCSMVAVSGWGSSMHIFRAPAR